MVTASNTNNTDLEAKAHDFLFSDELLKKNDALSKRFSLSEKAQDDLANSQNAVVFKEINLVDFIDTVKRIAVLAKQPSAEFVTAVAESFLYPLNDYFGGEPKKLLQETRPTFSTEKFEGGQAKKPVVTVEPKLSGFVTPAPVKPLPLKPIAPPPASKPKLTTDWLHQGSTAVKNIPPLKTVTTSATPVPVLEKVDSFDKLRAEKEELKKTEAKFKDFPRPMQKDDTIINSILAAVKIDFESEIQKIRFINALKNRLRDIRDQFETKEFLLRSENLGGVGLAPAVVEQVAPLIERMMAEHLRQLSATKKEEYQTTEAQIKIGQVEKKRVQEETVAEQQNARYKSLIKDKTKGLIAPLAKPLGFLKPKLPPTMEVLETAPSAISRPKMDDIKFSPTLVGPTEELKNFTLKDWQSLGAKAGVISQKLAVLRNESYAKYQTGLSAFRESPLFSLAQAILDESLAKGLPLAKVLEGRKNTNQPILSQAEINDIMSL